MTFKQAERIMGLEVRRVSGQLYAWGTEGLVITAPDGKNGAKGLVEANYKRISRLVLERAKWRCENCGAIRPLSVHHKTKRSHGRSDLPSNLMALCSRCHRSEHGTF